MGLRLASMPNFFAAFTSEVFRPLVTLLIPGAIAISTWFIGCVWHFPSLKTLVACNHAETGLLLLLAMTFAGLVLEDMGARVETHLDNKRDGKTGDHHENWNKYLRTAFPADLIGRRYIRTLVLRLKFELGAGFAMLSAALGLIWLASMGLSCAVFLVNEAICLAFGFLAFYEASCTHDTLGKNRANLLGEIHIVPPQVAAV
jgi:hypothetical protein